MVEGQLKISTQSSSYLFKACKKIWHMKQMKDELKNDRKKQRVFDEVLIENTRLAVLISIAEHSA